MIGSILCIVTYYYKFLAGFRRSLPGIIFSGRIGLTRGSRRSGRWWRTCCITCLR